MDKPTLYCPECGKSEPDVKFGVPQARRDGTWCIPCTWSWHRAEQAAGRQRGIEERAAMRAIVLGYYGEQCACCGVTEPLVVDHIHGDGRAHREEIGENGLYRWLIANDFPQGFQSLCNRCNISKGPGVACRLDHAADARVKTSLTLYYEAMADDSSGTKYLGQAGIARELGVTRQAVAKWRATFTGGDHAFPKPDAWVDGVPGWLPGRLPEIKAWSESRPGQGSGGGRPRKTA